MTLPLVETLLANPGLYIGTSRDLSGDGDVISVARIVVTPLPNKTSVALDYEARHGGNPNQHVEHAVIGPLPNEGLVLISSHPHDGPLSVLHEQEPGFFVARPGAVSFPMAIRVDVPEAGRLQYDWWYSRPGEPPVQHDETEVALVR